MRTPYTPEDIQKLGEIPSDQSIFSSLHFKQWQMTLEHAHIFPFGGMLRPVRFDDSEEDLTVFLQNISAISSPFDIGLGSQIEELHLKLDPVTAHLCQVAYELGCHEPVHYLPSEVLVDALKATDLQWVDAEAFTKIPRCLTIRLKSEAMKFYCDGELCPLDDMILYRVDNPLLRRHFLSMFGEKDLPSNQVWYWMWQSRKDLDRQVQNSSFGPLLIQGHTKLEDLLSFMDRWSRRADQNFLEDIAEQGAETWLHELAKRGEESRSSDITDEYKQIAAKNALASISDARTTEDVRRKAYREALEFLLKFVLLMSSDSFVTKPLPPPGVKPGKTSSKAKEIQARLYAKWGTRFVVTLDQESIRSFEGSEEDRRSPIRHRVRGHFKQQPYGPGNSLRKVIYRAPFWRGADRL